MTTPACPDYAGYRFPAEVLSHAVAPCSTDDTTIAGSGPLFIGDARVSTEDQQLDLRRDTPTAAL